MCGIIGCIGTRDAQQILLEGLRRLEYRGYDSAGVVIQSDRGLLCEKSAGNIAALERRLKSRPLHGFAGLGHTRWATHGPPTDRNAHPHFSCGQAIAVVHNGIIENYLPLKKRLTSRGHRFTSETDTEVIAHLIEQNYAGDPVRAVRKSVQDLKGSFALAVLFKDHPQRLVSARLHSPMVIGLDGDRCFIASDIAALVPFTRRVAYVQEHEIVTFDSGKVAITDFGGRTRKIVPVEIDWGVSAAEKQGYPHYMLKEISEEPSVAESELTGRLDLARSSVDLDDGTPPASVLKNVNRILITACGTAWHAGLYGKYVLEELAAIPVQAELASEVRYGDTPLDRRTLVIAISQSGETADTLAAIRHAREQGARCLAITNIRGSTLSRMADWVHPMRAGLEIGVAATKTYISQLIAVLLQAMHMGRVRKTASPARVGTLVKELHALPRKIENLLARRKEIKAVAEIFRRKYDFMYIGRKYNLATAYEGALKMKEISYLHAEGYGGGEMKHGPLALVDPYLTTVAIALPGDVYSKMITNMEEVKARRGKIVAVAAKGDRAIRHVADHVFEIDPTAEIVSPILAVVPLQLMAYYTAVSLGRDVDQPRNLAKSVTVE